MAPTKRMEREARARVTVSKTIPELLSRSPRAKHGLSQTDLIIDPSPVVETPANAPRHPRQNIAIRIHSFDPLQAASQLSRRPYALKRTANGRMVEELEPNVAIHNMGSLSRPGGGFLSGANAQEEFLCARTTLYTSLYDTRYPLPEVGGIFTPDVLVFRDVEGIDLPKRDRFFIDVITAGVSRHPDGIPQHEDEEPACSCGVSYCDRDRDLMQRKMKAVLRMAQAKGVRHLVLGAWGCGLLNHPVKDVAKLWRKVIAGSMRQRRPNEEQWEGIEEIIFAIPNGNHAREFRAVFDDILVPELSPHDSVPADSAGPGAILKEDAQMAKLLAGAASLELQIEQARTSSQRVRLREDLALVNRKLAMTRASQAARDDSSSADEDVEDGFVVDGYHGSDGEDNSYYQVDDSDSTTPNSDNYDFRFGQQNFSDSHDEDDLLEEGNWAGLAPSPNFDPKTGWFQGSIDELSAHVLGAGKRRRSGSISPRSPLVRRESCATNDGHGGVNDGFMSLFQ